MYYFVVNPAAKSGHGMEVWNQLKPVLEERGIPYEVYCSEKKGDITTLCRTVTTEKAAENPGEPLRLVIVGGDGTLNEAFQGIRDFANTLVGYIPAGSANDFATNTGVSQHPLEALEQILRCETPTRFDLGYMTYDDIDPAARHYFSSSCGIGYDAAVSREAAIPSPSKDVLNKLGLGSFVYLVMAIKILFSLKRGDCAMTLDGGRTVTLRNFLFVCSMIYRYEGGGFFFSPEANPSDGILDLCVFGGMPKWKVLLAFPSAYKGTHYKFKNVEPFRSETVHIRTSMPFWVQLDGEVSEKSAEISIVCEKQALRLMK